MNQASATTLGPRDVRVETQPKGRIGSVLVPLDGTEESLVALPVARLIAELEEATVHVVHIADKIESSQELLNRLHLVPEDLRGAILDLSSGSPAEEIVRLAGELDHPCIVMCTHTGPKDPISELGPVATDVVRRAPGLVVLVPPESGRQPTHLRHVLLPHDGSPTTAALARPALEYAARTDAELLVLHVVAPGASRLAEPGSFSAPLYVDQSQYEWPAWVQEFLERAHCPPEETKRLRMALAVGEPGDEIARFARDNHVDLIVLGWHGALNAEHATTVRAVLRVPPCPLLLLRLEEGEVTHP